MKIINLYSGSKGNSTYVGIQDKHILIDCGRNYKQLNMYLSNYDISIEDINAVLITHSHSDHISSLPLILKNTTAKIVLTTIVYADLLNVMQNKIDMTQYEDRFHMLDEKPLKVISYFDLKHDMNCVGYTIYDKDESFCFISDNGGYITNEMLDTVLYNHTYYSIESNYDETMQYLDTTRHEGLKRRVLGAYGHTSNVQAINNAQRMVGENTKSIIFTHLSNHCNTLELAQKTHQAYIEVWGLKTQFKNIDIMYANENESVVLNCE